MAIYRATAGAGFNHKQAQVIGSELEKLGNFSPRDVLDVAKEPDSPLHLHFTWDDEKAGESWRIHEARQLVNHITVLVSVDGQKQEAKAFYSVPVRIEETDTVEPRYVRIMHAVHDKAIQRTVLDDLLDDMNAFTKKYEQFKSIVGAELFQVIGETMKRIANEETRTVMLKKIYRRQPRTEAQA